jgi:hypothetical protein
LLTAAGKQHAQQGDDQRCCPHHSKRSLLQMRLAAQGLDRPLWNCVASRTSLNTCSHCRRRLTVTLGGASDRLAFRRHHHGISVRHQLGHCSHYVSDIFGAPLAIEGLVAAAPERHVHANFLPDDKIDADD